MNVVEIQRKLIDMLENAEPGLPILNYVLQELQNEGVGWIPVSERLPEDDDRYLIRYVYGESIKRTFVSDYLAIENKWSSFGIAVTHWQPLPAPPKEAT